MQKTAAPKALYEVPWNLLKRLFWKRMTIGAGPQAYGYNFKGPRVVPLWMQLQHPQARTINDFLRLGYKPNAFPQQSVEFAIGNQLKPWGGGVASSATLAGGLAAGTAGTFAPSVLKGGEPKEPEQPTGEQPTGKRSPAAMAGGAAAGALAGGLGSLLYGKLKKDPSLRRDVVFALIGAAAGTAAGAMVKTGHRIEFDSGFPEYLEKISGFWLPLLAGAGLTVGGSAGADWLMNSKARKEQAAATARAEEMQQQLREAQQQIVGNQKALQGAGVGALGGAAGMGLGSAAYGKMTGKENIRRDLILALLGAVSGGALGAYAGSRQQA